MSRVINTNSPTKIRNFNRRTIAEILQLLGHKTEFDKESKDMTAAIVYALRNIYDTADTAAQAWEKKGYWMKAERFLRQWEWTKDAAANLEDVVREEAWDLLPQLLMDIFPYFADIEIKSLTRKPDAWQGSYQRLLNDKPQNLL